MSGAHRVATPCSDLASRIKGKIVGVATAATAATIRVLSATVGAECNDGAGRCGRMGVRLAMGHNPQVEEPVTLAGCIADGFCANSGKCKSIPVSVFSVAIYRLISNSVTEFANCKYCTSYDSYQYVYST